MSSVISDCGYVHMVVPRAKRQSNIQLALELMYFCATLTAFHEAQLERSKLLESRRICR